MTNSDASASTAENKKNYKETLNLPKTTFPMKAGAAMREPEIEARWKDLSIYEKAMANRDKTKKFVLHDGPPYLSSDKIHIGTALNKILKDIVTRYKYQRGYYSPYVPGYDGHGLPIENKVVQSIKGGRKAISAVDLRKKCREFGLKSLKGQEENFKRLGIWGNWENPYVTTDAEFEAIQVKLFWEMYRKGYVYKGLKPVYWSPASETALADAEVEYEDHESHSIYVKFAINSLAMAKLELEEAQLLQEASVVIWTTTPWTTPANLAHSVHPNFTYVVIKHPKWGKLLLAKDLLGAFSNAVDLGDYELMGELQGERLEFISTQHPFIDRSSRILLGDHVTLDAGTGIVHTAPGHGMEDYQVCQQYDRDVFKDSPIGILSPLNDQGVYTDAVVEPRLIGQFYEKANEIVLELLREKNALLGHSKFTHSYPHDWRTHTPVIYRATEQWFVSVDKFRQQSLDAIKEVSWIPERGEKRISSMVENRSDWCISRQRVWGVPIPVFYDKATGESIINEAIINHLYAQFKVHTTDLWWEKSAEELLAGLDEKTCQELNLDNRTLTKEMDIMDVWFDSGVTHTAVVDARKEELGELPAELYLEGSDQHRGWFQSSLLTSMMVNEKAPYKSVLTHGFVMDGDGRKMSKSLGNVVDPNKIINQYGADVLRLWVASVDYSVDVRIGDEIVRQLVEVYKKIRNTVRYLTGNLADFDPKTNAVDYADLSDLDKYILHRLQEVVQTLTEAFDRYEFHKYYQVLQNFCVVELSSLYFDVAKDILYCDPVDGKRRRGMQTVLFELLTTLTPMLVPVLPHMADDIWQHLPEEQKPNYGFDALPESVTLAPWPQINQSFLDHDLDFKIINNELDFKAHVNISLELARKAGVVKSASDSEVILNALPFENCDLEMLRQFLVVSEVKIVDDYQGSESQENTFGGSYNDIKYHVRLSSEQKCERCWNYRESVGTIADAPAICSRCDDAVKASQKQPASV